jgi:GT2 family glycosyltransferase
MNKIGVGIVTCNRYEFLKKLVYSLPQDRYDYLTIVNDSDPSKETEADKAIERNIRQIGVAKNNLAATKPGEFLRGFYHRTGGNKGVGYAKNELFKNLQAQECDHIFIIEDDMLLTDKNVFDAYIKASKVTGLKHMMFGYHGPANKSNGKPVCRFKVPYNKELEIAFNLHCVGSFCYYHRDVLDEVGLFDSEYNNAWEHVDHSYMIAKAGYIPGYWYWPDLANSYDYITEQACSEDNSTIRPRADWQNNIIEGGKHFVSKHGFTPVGVPNKTLPEVYESIKHIRSLYGKDK